MRRTSRSASTAPGVPTTGGTLDKLASISGFRSQLTPKECHVLMETEGLALMAQTLDLVPADKKLYALRDVTATVDCLPLIASSIMSKKLAEGMDALVLDVKVGSGAFLKELPQARELARTLMALGQGMGKQVTAWITDMDQPLGTRVGNALELVEALEVLQGKGPADTTELTFALGAEMLLLGKVATSEADARAQLQGAVETGAGMDKLMQVVSRQGGDASLLEHPGRLPRAKGRREVRAERAGFVAHLFAEPVGHAAVTLGAGRERVDSTIDPAVGFTLVKKVGDRVDVGEVLAYVEYNDAGRAEAAAQRLLLAYDISTGAPPARPLLLEHLT